MTAVHPAIRPRTPDAGGDARPHLAVISNGYTPYRHHVLRRMAAEIPGLRLSTLYTHEFMSSPWPFDMPAELNPVVFGKGEYAVDQMKPRYALWNWRKGGRVIRWLAAHDVRAVLIDGYADLGRARVLRWCGRHGVPTLMFGDSNIHCDTHRGWRAVAKKALVTPFIRGVNGILCCGRFGQAYFAKYGCPPDRMFLFPYEPDYDEIRSVTRAEVEQVKARLGLHEGRRRLVFSGRLVPAKRPDLLVDAFLAIAERRPQWDLVMAGEGPMREGLEAKVPAPLRDRVKWAGFLAPQRVVTALYLASDVLVLPSDYEPWALVINEAAAAGIAVVASSVVGAAAELVRDGVNGRIFPAGDVEALTQCLLDVTDPDRIDGMKSRSPEVLADWRKRADPIDGLRKALRSCGVPVDAS